MNSSYDISKLTSNGHSHKYGSEYIKFTITENGKLSYFNCSSKREDRNIRREVYLSNMLMKEIQRMIMEEGILDLVDNKWPKVDKIDRQELEIVFDKKSVLLETKKISSFFEVKQTNDSDNLGKFYFFIQDLKNLIDNLLDFHCKDNPY